MEVSTRENDSLDVRRTQDLIQAFSNADTIINKNYLRSLEELEVIGLPSELDNIDIISKARFIKINKLVYSKNENILDKLTTILNAASVSRASVATIINSDGNKIDYYIGVINKNSEEDLTVQAEILEGTFGANFAGSKLNKLTNNEFEKLYKNIFDKDDNERKIITSVSGVAALRASDTNDAESYIQGLEKFVDSLNGKAYTVILIADSVPNDEIQVTRAGYENLYSQLTPFLKSELSFNESDSLTLTEGSTTGITDTFNTSISYTQNYSESNGWSNSKSSGESETKNIGAALGLGAAALGTAVGTIIGGPAGAIIGGAIGGTASSAIGALVGSKTHSENTTNGQSHNTSISSGESNQEGSSKSTSSQSSTSTSEGNTRGRSIQISCENRGVKTLLERIDEQLERIKKCEDVGTFCFGAYFISNSPAVNEIAASTYNALMRGENSSVECSFINTWYDGRDNRRVQKYLEKLSHPLFKLYLNDNDEYIKVSPASIVSGKELAMHIALPKKSIAGLPVVESAEFGRNIFTLSDKNTSNSFKLGKIYHMGQCENTDVNLDSRSLAMHTFITGSTGSGKSNTIYNILRCLNNNKIKFLVVEPAKGEYKNVLGYRTDVTVLGTNPKKTKLLKINPFKFSEEIHVLEHIDRLIEIFNVCWPMYAAMPAVLKDAVERAYEECGWDLDLSENKYNENLFPTFADVLIKINEVVNESSFSEEVKGNYVGALVTRVKSLTKGINGRIFSSDEIDNAILFDSNVIVDLSRVGSVETKSMIMGILVMRLQEYRIAQGGMNVSLKHVTVLEEAHNILKRTSTEQSSEGSNLIGKSVEMISNSISEMRTYGEGFIIADQAPGLLDMSVIRNTNTKIILRLPDQSDRELVGKAAGLNDEQIFELAKLETGVSAVYQNNWLEPVLCKTPKYTTFEEYKYSMDDNYFIDTKPRERIVKYLLSKMVRETNVENVDLIKELVLGTEYGSAKKAAILKILDNELKEKLDNDLAEIISEIFESGEAFEKAKRYEDDIEKWNEALVENIKSPVLKDFPNYYQDVILQCIFIDISNKYSQLEELAPKWVEFMRESRHGGIL